MPPTKDYMNRKVKLLRRLALALLALEQAVSTVSQKVGEYTLSVYANQIADEEEKLLDDAIHTVGEREQEWAFRIHDWVCDDNTVSYNNLADELELEGA